MLSNNKNIIECHMKHGVIFATNVTKDWYLYFIKSFYKSVKKKNTPIGKCTNNMNSQFIKRETERKKIPSKIKKLSLSSNQRNAN